MLKNVNFKAVVLSCAGMSLLILCAVWCALGALISAFDFDLAMRSLGYVLFIAVVLAVVMAAVYKWRGMLITAIPAAVLFIWNFARIAEEFRWVVHNITILYNKWIPVPVLFPEMAVRVIEPIFFFSALGILLALLLAAAICIRRSTLLTVLITLPVVLLTLVLTDTQPAPMYIPGLIAVYLALLLSSAFYLDDPMKSAIAAIPSLALSLTFIFSVYLIVPPSRYERADIMETARRYVTNIAQGIAGIAPRRPDSPMPHGTGWPALSDSGVWHFDTSTVDVTDAGWRRITNQNLIEITVSEPGTFYLRGFSLSDFDGKRWTQDAEHFNDLAFIDRISRERPAAIISEYYDFYAGQLSITEIPLPPVVGMFINKIDDKTDIDYIPYYYGNAYLYPSVLTDYPVRFFHVPESVRELAGDEAFSIPDNFLRDFPPATTRSEQTVIVTGSDPDYVRTTVSTRILHGIDDYFETYTQIDPATAEGLRELAAVAGIDPSAERSEIADAVGAYVRSRGIYSLTPTAIPEGEDFALYFLQSTREGYCVHFATAATLMLRALDIPARFTSGYVVTVSRFRVDSPVMLTDANAHAWVEVFYDDFGWLPLEVTPSASGSAIPPSTQHTPPTPTPESSPRPSPSPTPPDSPDGESPTPPSPAPGDTPGSSGPGAVSRPAIPSWLSSAFIFIACTAALIGALFVRRHIVYRMRNRRFLQEDTNAAVLCMWRYIVKISKKQSIPPTDLEELALKARFSQHRISKEEHEYMLSYTRRLAEEISTSKEGFSRFWFKYVRAMG